MAAETHIEQKLARGMCKASCVISARKERYVVERWVKTIQRPESEFKHSPKPAPDPNATRVYPGVLEPKKNKIKEFRLNGTLFLLLYHLIRSTFANTKS